MILLGTLTVGPTVTVLIDKSRVKFLFGVDVCSCTCHKTVVVILSSTPPANVALRSLRRLLSKVAGFSQLLLPCGNVPKGRRQKPGTAPRHVWLFRGGANDLSQVVYVCMYIYI